MNINSYSDIYLQTQSAGLAERMPQWFAGSLKFIGYHRPATS